MLVKPIEQHRENMTREYKRDLTIKEYFDRGMHRECDDNVNQTHFGQLPLSVNEFAKRHSIYIEGARTDKGYNDGEYYPSYRSFIWECYCEYYEAFKYNGKGFLEWIGRVNSDMIRLPYPIQKDMIRFFNDRELDYQKFGVNLVTPMTKIRENK